MQQRAKTSIDGVGSGEDRDSGVICACGRGSESGEDGAEDKLEDEAGVVNCACNVEFILVFAH